MDDTRNRSVVPDDLATPWQLDPESPYYDEFSSIRPGQWWINTEKGIVGCSDEEDAHAILAAQSRINELEAEITRLEAVARAARDLLDEELDEKSWAVRKMRSALARLDGAR